MAPVAKTAARGTAEKPKPVLSKVTQAASAFTKAAPVAATQRADADKPAEQAADIRGLTEKLRRGDLASRSDAAVKLAAIGDKQATSALVEALRDPTAELACEAASALGHLKDDAALHALIDVVLNRDGYFHGIVRSAAAQSLGQLKNALAVEALLASVRDQSFETSVSAIYALGKIGDTRAVPALKDATANADGFFLQAAQNAAAEVLATFPT